MSTLFSFIFLISLITTVFYFVSFRKSKDSKEKKKVIYSAVIMTISFLIVGIFAPEESEKTEDAPTLKKEVVSAEKESKGKELTEASKEETEEEAKTPEERMTNFINKKLGEKTNMKVDRVVHVQKFGEAFEVLLYADENLTTNLFYNGMLYDAATIFEELQTYEDVTGDVLVAYNFKLVDAYGNASEEKILSVRLTQEALDKINFDNFNVDNFENIADVFFVHPAVK